MRILFLLCLVFASSLATAQTCTPTSCSTQGLTCGITSDGCGGTLQCGGCTGAQTCGGGGTPNVCGTNTTCTGLCLLQTTCPGTSDTTIRGTVYMPNGVLPLPNVLVYVPSKPAAPFPPGVACANCSVPASGAPLISAITDVDGQFVLHNAPVGTNIPLIIQIGRWRRQVVVSTVAACTDNQVPASSTRLPRTQFEGDIPLTAVVTGAADASECLLRNIGLADSEFTNPSGPGRIRLYAGSSAAGATIDPGTSDESQLFTASTSTNQFDAIILDCQGVPETPSSIELGNLDQFVSAGGRVMLTHDAYPWINATPGLNALTTWNVGQSFAGADHQDAALDSSFLKGQTLTNWLYDVHASTTLGYVQVSGISHDYDGVLSPSTNWLSSTSPVVPLQFALNTPIGTVASQQCGRVVFADHHPYGTSAAGTTFPSECATGAMTPAQILAAYTWFDTTNCVQSDTAASVVGLYEGNRQDAATGTKYTNLLQAQILGSDGMRLGGAPVTFTVVAGSGGASGSFAGGVAETVSDYNGVATAPMLTAGGTAGPFTVTATSGSASATFTMYVGDVIFADGFE